MVKLCRGYEGEDLEEYEDFKEKIMGLYEQHKNNIFLNLTEKEQQETSKEFIMLDLIDNIIEILRINIKEH